MFDRIPVAIVFDDIKRIIHAQFEDGNIEEYAMSDEYASDEMWQVIKEDLAALVVQPEHCN
jgi:hypothetical protein